MSVFHPGLKSIIFKRYSLGQICLDALIVEKTAPQSLARQTLQKQVGNLNSIFGAISLFYRGKKWAKIGPHFSWCFFRIFGETSKGGVGVISDLKFVIADSLQKKTEISWISRKITIDFLKKVPRGGGGGKRPFGVS